MNRSTIKHFIFIIFLSIPAIEALGQELQLGDSSKITEKEILSHQETELSLLGKSRAVLLEALKSNDMDRASKVLQFMENRFDSSKVVALFPTEEVLVAYWLRDYESVFSFAKDVEPNTYNYQNKILPPRDLFFNDLRKLSQKESLHLADKIKMYDLNSDKRDFLYLFLKYVLTVKKETKEENEADQRELNQAADEYVQSYKGSEFVPFINRYIRYVILKSKWGFGWEIAAGYLSLPTSLGSHLKDFGLLSMAIESAYEKLYGCLRIDIGAAHNIRKGFVYNGTWKDGLLVMQTGVLFSLGQMLDLGNNFTLTPQLGIGYYDFSPPKQEKSKEGNDVSISFGAWALGLNFDIPLTGVSGGTYLRTNVGYRTAMTNIDIAKGGYFFFTIGVAMFGRPEYRDL